MVAVDDGARCPGGKRPVAVFTQPLLPTLRFSLAVAIARVNAVPAPALERWSPDARIEALFWRFPPLRDVAQSACLVSDGDGDKLVRRSRGQMLVKAMRVDKR